MHRATLLVSFLVLASCNLVTDSGPGHVGLPVACPPESGACARAGVGRNLNGLSTVSETINLSAAGLFTNPNPVGGEVPDGALTRARNVVIDRPGVISPRRGMAALGYTLGDTSAGRAGFTYKDALLVHTDDNGLRRDTGTEFVLEQSQETGSAAVVIAPSQFDAGARVRFAESLGKLYMTSASGILEKDGLTAPLRRPGAPRAYDISNAEYVMTGSGVGSGHLIRGGVTAYRVVFGYNDAQGRPVLGEPSGRRIIKNPSWPGVLTRTSNVVTVSIAPSVWPANFEPFAGFPFDITEPGVGILRKVTGTVPTSSTFTYSDPGPDFSAISGYTISYPAMNTTLSIPIPPDVRVGDFLQIYRTASVVSIYDDPGDNMGQVGELIITSAMKTAGSVEFPDNTPDALRQRPLYTNAGQEGLTQANARPPIARDMTMFRDSLFLANTIGPHRLTIRFLGNPEYGDTITIAGKTYTGLEFPSGTYSYVVNKDPALTTSQQIEATARSLIDTINNTIVASSVAAYYASSDSDAPGIIVLESKYITASPFTVIASANGDRFEPQLVSAATSTQDVRPNRLHYSKPGLPYAFPLGNTLAIGDESTPITRILALRESLFVFKDGAGEGKGVWRVTGNGPGSWSVAPFNFGAHLVAPESAVVVDNQVFGLFAGGVASVSDSGVDTISVPIEDQMQALITETGTNLATVSFGVSYEAGTERKFMLWVPGDKDDTLPVQAYVYNLNTETWTTRDDIATFGIVGGAQKLLFTGGTGGVINRERRGYGHGDFMDAETAGGDVFTVTPEGFIGAVEDVANLLPDMAVWTDSGSEYAAMRVTAINYETGAVTLANGTLHSQTEGEAWHGALPILTSVAWTVNSANYPTAQKQFFETSLLTEGPVTGEFTFNFNADLDPTTDTAVGYAEGTPYCRTEVPWESQRTTRLRVQVDRKVSAETPNYVGISSRVNIYGGLLSR